MLRTTSSSAYALQKTSFFALECSIFGAFFLQKKANAQTDRQTKYGARRKCWSLRTSSSAYALLVVVQQVALF